MSNSGKYFVAWISLSVENRRGLLTSSWTREQAEEVAKANNELYESTEFFWAIPVPRGAKKRKEEAWP